MPSHSASSSPPAIVLASGSAYRRELLERLLPEFDIQPPDIDESPRPGEKAAELALRLASEKAAHVAASRPGAIVIGSDQVAAIVSGNDESLLGKPGDKTRATEQLRASSGREVVFHTAVCVTHGETRDCHVDLTRVRFRDLTDAEIDGYLDRETPYDCAGSFRSEGLGITLFSEIENRDPSALQGLPLIWLAGALARAGVEFYA